MNKVNKKLDVHVRQMRNLVSGWFNFYQIYRKGKIILHFFLLLFFFLYVEHTRATNRRIDAIDVKYLNIGQVRVHFRLLFASFFREHASTFAK